MREDARLRLFALCSLQAVATLLQSDTTAIVSLKGRGVDRPRDLDNKVCLLVAFVIQPLRRMCSINLQPARSQQPVHTAAACLFMHAVQKEEGGGAGRSRLPYSGTKWRNDDSTETAPSALQGWCCCISGQSVKESALTEVVLGFAAVCVIWSALRGAHRAAAHPQRRWHRPVPRLQAVHA